MIKRIKKNNSYQLLLVFFLVAVSGIPFFVGNRYFFPIFYLFLLFKFLTKKYKIEKFALVIFLSFSIVLIVQMIIFKKIVIYSNVALLIKITTAYFIIKELKENFVFKYVEVIYRIAIISLVLHTLFNLLPSLREFAINDLSPILKVSTRSAFYEYADNIIIYTFTNGEYIRNSGPFWEPGGYAIFLSIALLLNLRLTLDIKEKKNFVLIITLLSTISTAGYINLFLIISYYYIKKKNLKSIALFYPIIFAIALFFFMSFEFLGFKIFSHINATKNTNINESARTRFVSAIVDWEDIKKYPFTGRGRDNETRFDNFKGKYTYLEHRNNGITNFLTEYGFVVFFIYFYGVYKSFFLVTLQKKDAVIFTLLFLFLGFSQIIFEKPLIISFVFYHIAFINKKKYENYLVNVLPRNRINSRIKNNKR